MSNEKMTIEVNMGNLSEDERAQFKSLIEKANTPPQKKWWVNTEFDIKKGDAYYVVGNNGEIISSQFTNTDLDYDRNKFGNACKNRNYIKQRTKDIWYANLIANFAHVVNGQWREDWSNMNERKYYCRYNQNAREWNVAFENFSKIPGVAYFKSRALAQRCIDEIILPFERGEL